MSAAQTRGGYIGQAWLVILLALAYGGALAGVQTAVSGKIAANKRAETFDVIPDLVAGADKAKTAEFVVEGTDGKQARVYRVFDADGDHVGWVLPGEGQGFADRIALLIGLDARLDTITGLYVLEQKETPGLGNYITSEDFRARFAGKPTDQPVAIVKSEPQADNEIRALTGATVSSESVAAIVNGTIANLKEPVRQQAAAAGAGPAIPAATR